MKCDICKTKEAVIHIQQVSASGRKNMSFCMECAQRFGIHADGSKLEMSFQDLSSNIASLQDIVKNNDNRTCPVCGCSSSTLFNKGLLGCPECYEIYKEDVKKAFAAKGLTGPYCGTMPQRLSHFKSILNDRIVLQNKLRESIETENYEKAALYRDRLNALNNCRPNQGFGLQGGADFE